MKTTAPKLTLTEKRAVALCEEIKHATRDGGKYALEVEWIKSRTWGSNPRILHRGEKCTNISGYGYCKRSACLAAALKHLGETEDQKRRIERTYGAGVSSVRDALAECGWVLESVASGKLFECYLVSRKP